MALEGKAITVANKLATTLDLNVQSFQFKRSDMYSTITLFVAQTIIKDCKAFAQITGKPFNEVFMQAMDQFVNGVGIASDSLLRELPDEG